MKKTKTQNQMKIFMCKVRVTEVREGIEMMEAPSGKIAKDPAWLILANAQEYLEELTQVKKTCEIMSVKEVTQLGQVPKEWHDALPWHHPNHSPKDEVTIERRLSREVADQTDAINSEIELLQKQKSGLDEEISKLHALLPKKRSLNGH